MRDPRELLALLTTRIQRFHMAPGGAPTYTPEDVAHALGMIKSDEARIYARVKYAGQVEYAEGVCLAIRRHIMVRKLDDSWRIPRKEFLLDLSRLVLLEAIDPNTCPWCHGVCSITNVGRVMVCQSCNGSGKRMLKEKDKAELLGIMPQSWSNTWAERYRDAQVETVDRWEDIFTGSVRVRMHA